MGFERWQGDVWVAIASDSDDFQPAYFGSSSGELIERITADVGEFRECDWVLREVPFRFVWWNDLRAQPKHFSLNLLDMDEEDLERIGPKSCVGDFS